MQQGFGVFVSAKENSRCKAKITYLGSLKIFDSALICLCTKWSCIWSESLFFRCWSLTCSLTLAPDQNNIEVVLVVKTTAGADDCSSVTASCWHQRHGHLTNLNSTASSQSCTTPLMSLGFLRQSKGKSTQYATQVLYMDNMTGKLSLYIMNEHLLTTVSLKVFGKWSLGRLQ